MGSPTIVRVEGVSKRFLMHRDKSVKERLLNFSRARQHRDDFWALRDIDLEIATGSSVGLVGHNGSGKSTLLKVLGGIIQPTSGTVHRRGRLAALLELGAGFHADLTGRENVYLNAAILGLTRSETDRYFDAIVDFSGIEEFIDTQVKFYSSGMYVRLAFAVAVHVDPDLLLVDEVLAVGDEPFQRKCMAKISEFQRDGRTIVLVSHSADQVASLCDQVVVLNHGVMLHNGETAEGLRVLRAGFEAERELETATRESEADSPIAGTARITHVDVKSSGLTATGVFLPGSDVSVTIRFDIADDPPPAGWIAGLDVETPMGQVIYRVNTQGLRIELPRRSGSFTLNFDLPAAAFGGGQYVLTASLVTSIGEDSDRRPRAVAFSVEDDPRGAGLLRIDASAEIVLDT